MNSFEFEAHAMFAALTREGSSYRIDAERAGRWIFTAANGPVQMQVRCRTQRHAITLKAAFEAARDGWCRKKATSPDDVLARHDRVLAQKRKDDE